MSAATSTATSAPAKRELHVQRKALADTEVLGRQAEVRQLPAATRRSIVPNDVRVLDLDGADPEIEIDGRSAAVGSGRVAGRRRSAAEILPIVGAAAIAREIELEPRQARLADLDALREQRQQGEAQLGAADARHRLVAEAGRVAQAWQRRPQCESSGTARARGRRPA